MCNTSRQCPHEGPGKDNETVCVKPEHEQCWFEYEICPYCEERVLVDDLTDEGTCQKCALSDTVMDIAEDMMDRIKAMNKLMEGMV